MSRKNFGAKPFLYPQPVMIIGTYDENGKANAMNAAWGGIVGMNEILVDLGSHKTTENIIKTKAFTVSIADAEHVVACDYVGVESGNKEPEKMKKAGFTTTKSEFVNAPVINELPLVLECELKEVIGNKYIGEIKNASADESILGEDGEIDLDKFSPITYDTVHHGYYKLGERVGNAFKDGLKLKNN
ncbi:MAG: flavin reductase family protein [Ruminococcus sp.]|nr:flavin reductase family protein [Ruminococcus sp.]